MLAASFDQRRQHRAVGKRLGALAGCTISLCVCRSPQEIARLHGAIGDLRTGGSRDRAHIVAVGHRAAIARDAACVLAAGRDRAHVVAVGHRARAAAGDAAHAVDARDRTGIAAGRHAARVIAHDAAGIPDNGFRIAGIGMGTFAADNDALAPAVQELRRVIGVPRDAAHIEPSVHIARHRQVFHRSAAQPAEQTDIICRSKAFAIIIASPRNTQAPDGVAAAVKGAGVGLLLAADGIHPAGRLAGSRCVTAIRVERTAVHDDVAGQHGAQVSPAVPVHLHPEQLQLLPAADPAGILLRAAAHRVAGHRRPVRPDPDALIDHLALVHTVIIDPCQEGIPLLVRALRHHGEEVLAQHLPRIVLAVRLICQRMLFPQEGDAGLAAVPFPGIFLADDRAKDDLYRLVKAAADDRAAHQGASASAAIVALTRHLTVECAAGDGAAVCHLTLERAVFDGVLVRHFVLERTVLDDAAHLVHHRVLERTAADGALALHSTGKHAVLDAAVALHRAIERAVADNSGFLRTVARSAAHLAPERAALDGAVVLHLVLERTVLDGAALLVRHLTRKRTAVDGALILNRALELTFFDDTAAVVGVGPGGTHRTVERGGAGRSLASGDVFTGCHIAADGAAVCVQDALEIYAHIDLCIAADGKRAPAAEDMLLFALGSFCGDLRRAADGRAAAEADAAAVPFCAADADRAAVLNAAAPHDEHTVVADTAASAAGHAALDDAAVHEERAVLLLAVAVYLHGGAVTAVTAVAVYLACGTAVDTGARIHLEAAVFADTHAAAAAAAGLGIKGPAAYDAAALHDEGAVLYVYTAAAVGAAAIDNAAVDSLCAARLIQHPQMVCIWLKFVFFRGVAVHHRQLPAFAGFFVADHKHAAVAGLRQHLAVQIQCDLVCDLQRALGQLDIIRQPDTHRFVCQRIPQRLLRADLCIACELPFRRQGDVFCNGLLEVICRSVSFEPAVKGVVGLVRLGAGLPRRRAALQKMLGVHRAVRHVRHSDLAGKRDTGADGAVTQHIARLLERAAFNASALVVGHTAGKSGAAAAGDRAVAVHYSAGNRTAVGAQGAARAVHRAAGAGGCAAGINGAGVQLEHTLSAESHSAAPPILGVRCIIRPACRDAAAVHGKAAVLHIHAAAKFPRFSAPADAVTDYAVLHGKAAAILDIHTASAGLLGGAAEDAALVHGKCAPRDNHTAAQAAGGAADDAAPVHGKRGPIDTFSVVTFKKHTAAVTVDAVGAVGGAAHDAAALHGQMSAGVDIYAAAIKVPLTQCSRAAGNDAAGDALFASRIQHPQAVAVRCEPALLRIRPAVGDG